MCRQAPPSHAGSAAAVCYVEGSLLRSSSCFPYFMLVALEAGSSLRALLLLLVYPLLSLLSEDTRIRAMTLVAFCGVRVSSFRVGATVLPKHLLEDVGEEGFRLLMRTGKNCNNNKVCVSRMPKVMVEEFLTKYLKVDAVLARELKVFSGFYTGFVEQEKSQPWQQVAAVREADRASWPALPAEEYPEPLVFHDGRIAFRPTPLSAFAMFVWLPFGCFLSLLRLFLFLVLPYGASIPALAFTGMKNRVVGSPFPAPGGGKSDGQGRLFVCNHRSLIDPIWVSAVLGDRLISLVYGVSASTRLLSPLRTVVLTRAREEDKLILAAELRHGDVALFPEGTTCREPFVLRFSPLFAEVADRVLPVALSSYPSMFHGTSVNGRKALDPFALLANPYVYYAGEFLASLPAGRGRCSRETANQAQAAVARALGFRCSGLSRKHKYRYLAGCDGLYHVKP